MGRRRFLEEGGAAAESVIFPLLYQPCEASRGFEATFKRRFETAPDYAAARTYDAVRLLVAAIRTAGLNRARIRDTLKELAPWEGVAGTVNWDGLGANSQPVPLGTIHNGRVVPVVAPLRENRS
jgi:ABC-type branched-subunit amino acid transport system substrate-binding protein